MDEKYSLLSECTACGSIKVRKFKSNITGISIVVAQVPGPLVHGAFVVATEANTDDGLPHTLEHLIFLGSDDYPYKGTLDIIANRCLASGTNAWTDVDHTCYTVSTVGMDGFLKLFPVYLDHLFFPTLTDAGFTTEVYHVTGEGTDAGVVFSEMQHYESDAEALTVFELYKGLYARSCGYRYETGGSVCNLRKSTSIEKIRKYHRKFYCPENTTLIVSGLVEESRILNAVSAFEQKLLQKRNNDIFQKAWQKAVPSLKSNVVKAVSYPSDDENYGIVLIGWQGPSVVNEYYQTMACNILCQYLTRTAASPLTSHFVESEHSFCSEVSFTIVPNSTCALYFSFENVVLEKIPLLHEELTSVLHWIANKRDNFQINGQRMSAVIERFAQKQLLAFEKEPEYEIASNLIGDVLYGGASNNGIQDRLNHRALSERFATEPITFWYELLEKYLIKNANVTVLGYPSKKAHLLQTYFVNERINMQKAKLGADGLREKALCLEKAKKENEKLPPDHVIASVDAPETSPIQAHCVHEYSTSTDVQYAGFSLKDVRVFTQLNDIKSQFVYLNTIMDSSELSVEERLYLPLLLEYIVECPISRNGQQISHEVVAKELETDVATTVRSSIGIEGANRFSCGVYSYALVLSLVVSPEKFQQGVNWIRELLCSSLFTVDRLKVVVNKLISSISQMKREGRRVIKDLMKVMLFKSDTNFSLCSLLCQLQFLSETAKKLQNPAQSETVVQELQSIIRRLTRPKNIMLHVAADVSRLVEIYENAPRILNNVLPDTREGDEEKKNNRLRISQDKEFLYPTLGGGTYSSCIVAMASMEAAYLYLTAPAIHDFNDKDLPGLLVFIQYVTQLEGPLWRDVRGLGLAYHYSVRLTIEEGILNLLLGRATDVVQAFQRTENIFNHCVRSVKDWNKLHFHSAKSSLIFELAEREKNLVNVVNESLLASFRGTSIQYNKRLIDKIGEVSLDDVERIGRTYIPSLLDPKSSLLTIICHHSKKEAVAAGFASMGRPLVEFSSLEDSYMNVKP